MHHAQVKTRMQLETGRSKYGLVGTFRNIIKEEGCVNQFEADSQLTKGFRVGRLYRGKRTGYNIGKMCNRRDHQDWFLLYYSRHPNVLSNCWYFKTYMSHFWSNLFCRQSASN